MIAELPECSNSVGVDPDCLREVKSSTCLLLPATPSPTPLEMEIKHPLEDQMTDTPLMVLSDDPDILGNLDMNTGDSSSSAGSNSIIQDPVSAQLINNISMLDYQTLTKDADIISEVDNGKLNGNISTGSRKLPYFVNWNWPLIRKILLWLVVSALVACISAIIALIVNIPKHCNPDLPWHQGKIFYEIFPASFKDSNDDGIGDFRGIIDKLDYIENLGVSAIRLNYIFEAEEYPEKYYNVTSLLHVDKGLGTLQDFQQLVKAVHDRNISMVLDIPVQSLASRDPPVNYTSHTVLLGNNSASSYFDQTSSAIAFWARTFNVDGFYLKGLEKFTKDVNFAHSLRVWKQIIGYDKILIASENTYKRLSGDTLNAFMSRIDLVDIHLSLEFGVNSLKETIQNLTFSDFWSKPHFPWIHWNIGNIDSQRISTKHIKNTLVLTSLELMLPGTISIFYGDEIGLTDIDKSNIEADYTGHDHLHNLVPMKFPKSNEKQRSNTVLSWNSESYKDPDHGLWEIIKHFKNTRDEHPTIYLRGIYKEGNLLRNMAVRKTDNDLVVIERWYPRRSTCVFVANLENNAITADLSTMFYGGRVLASTNITQIGEDLYFDRNTFPPNSAMLLKIEK